MIEGLTHKDLIDIELIPKDEREEYLVFFSEGSKELKSCLKTMWDMNLYTSACCKGHDITESVYNLDGKDFYIIDLYAYICMKPNNYISEYLSENLIVDPYVHISRFEDNREAIYIYGRDRFKKLNELNNNLKSGKKDNKILLDLYLNKNISSNIIKKCYREYFYDNNFYFDEIRDIEYIDDTFRINAYTNYLSRKQIDKLCDEHNKILKKVRIRNLSKGK
jgi:hypothetical protein